MGNLETGECYSSRFRQDAAKIALLSRQRWRLLAFATACLMLLTVGPAVTAACRRRLPMSNVTKAFEKLKEGLADLNTNVLDERSVREVAQHSKINITDATKRERCQCNDCRISQIYLTKLNPLVAKLEQSLRKSSQSPQHKGAAFIGQSGDKENMYSIKIWSKKY